MEIKEHTPTPVSKDFMVAAALVISHQQGSASLLQRRMQIGYNKADDLVNQLEYHGVVGGAKGSKARDVLYDDPDVIDLIFVPEEETHGK